MTTSEQLQQWRELTPGQFFTVPAHGIAPAVIRTFTHAPVAHAVVYVGLQPGGWDCLQAEPGGVSPTSVAHWQAAGPIYPSKHQLTPEQSQIGQQYALSLQGAGYSFIADALIGIREGLGIPVDEDLFRLAALTKHVECAQYADLVGIKMGADYFSDGRLPGEVSPADLWRLDYAGTVAA